MNRFCYIIFSIALILSFLNASAQNDCKFDSLKIFYLKFKSTQLVKIDEDYLSLIGDSLKTFKSLSIDSIYSDLTNVRGQDSISNTKRKYSRSGIDLRLLFVFYKNGIKTSIGFSPSMYMFIENQVSHYKKEDLIDIKYKYQILSRALSGVF